MFKWPWKRRVGRELYPDEIFLDSRNLPSFNKQQFEGQIEKPINKRNFHIFAGVFLILGLLFTARIGFLQIAQGEEFALRSERNKLRHTMIFPDRGIIYDRNEVELAWNDLGRVYTDKLGFAHILGFVGLPNEEELERFNIHPQALLGKDGVERTYNSVLAGRSGIRIEEVDALGNIQSDHVLRSPESGQSVYLSLDAKVQQIMYKAIAEIAEDIGYTGGAGVIMDNQTGEIIALVSYPEYNPTVMSTGEDREQINRFLNDQANPFLNRAVGGLYAPGSVIKLFVAVAALAENVINPERQILSERELVVPNPYNPSLPTIFRDWRAHGLVDMRRAIAVSSNIYFYQIGGGYRQSQPGLGISRIESYSRLFGFGAPTGIALLGEVEGVIPNPEWKARNFDNDPWRLGDTYHTAIGQFGYLISPIQLARGVGAIANDGRLLTPKLLLDESPQNKDLQLSPRDLQIVREGMRQAVTDGTAGALNVPYVSVAAKTGTAEIGLNKSHINAWITGFFPYENPRYSFAVVMERGPQGTVIGGGMVMRRILDGMQRETPEYFKTD